MPRPNVILLAPGLLGPWPGGLRGEVAGGLSAPALCEVLRRAGAPASPAVAEDAEPWPLEGLILAALFPSYPVAEHPYAALTYAHDAAGARPGQWVMRCDPVHLRADVGTAYLFGAEHLALDRDESEALAAELNEHLEAEGLEIEPLAPTRWYVRLNEAPRVVTFPPSLVAAREVGAFLPAGEAGARWRRWWNELQMILHTSEVNARRLDRGQLVVNSVWFWGPGRLPAVAPRAAPASPSVWSAHPLVGGLGALGWAQARPEPLEGAELVPRLGPGAHLVVLEAAQRAVLANDVEGWRGAVEAAEARWLVPLLEALDRGCLGTLSLRPGLAPGTRALTARPRRRWRGWRRRRPLAELLSTGRAGG